jgi:hypothetical protein
VFFSQALTDRFFVHKEIILWVNLVFKTEIGEMCKISKLHANDIIILKVMIFTIKQCNKFLKD